MDDVISLSDGASDADTLGLFHSPGLHHDSPNTNGGRTPGGGFGFAPPGFTPPDGGTTPPQGGMGGPPPDGFTL